MTASYRYPPEIWTGTLTGNELVPVDAGSVFPTQMTVSALGVQIASLGGQMLTPQAFVATAGSGSDDTAALNAWLAAGGGLLPVPSAGFYKISGTLVIVNANTRIIGQGPVSLIKLVLPAGAAAVPVIDVQSTATGTLLWDFACDGGAAALAQNTVYGGNAIAPSGILVQADYCHVSGLRVSNAFDNGISLVQMSTLGVVNSGSPQHVVVSDCQTSTCGIGVSTGTKPGMHGAGIDMASCAQSSVSNCVDFSSYGGFIIDTGAGAMCSMVNCTSGYAQLDLANIGNGSGLGFYFGSANCQVANCVAISPGGHGFWLDSGVRNQISNCYTRMSGGHGFWVKGAWQMVGCVVYDASQSATSGITGQVGHGVVPYYDGFYIDASAGSITQLTAVGCASYGTSHYYGWNEVGGGHTVNAFGAGCFFVDASGLGYPAPAFTAGLVTQNTTQMDYFKPAANAQMVFSPPNGTSFQVSNPNAASATDFVVAKGAVNGSNVEFQGWSNTSANVNARYSTKGAGSTIFGAAANKVGFFDSAGTLKPSLTGAKGGNGALGSLISALAAMGLVTDSTTA
jgi:hypothetical protein